MILSILAGISQKLRQDFPGMRVYRDDVEQGLEPPCFLVQLLEPSRAQMVGQWWRQEQLFCVQFFPKTGKNTELYEVGGALFATLETVPLPDGGLHGTGLRFEVADGVLHFFVSYTAFLRRRERQEHMETLHLQENVKE